ncbi:MAG: DUF308 domain-containing protein [Erythrobacter sp.]|jgi:uncharacterized membrane protein HdeD (DUF308 family)|nr:DUF308 domain-containing protein [Erythrobacter sp.]
MSIWLFVGAAAFAAIGLLAILNPVVTGLATGLLLGFGFLVTGVGSLVSTLSGGQGLHRGIGILFGLLALATGAVLTFFPLSAAVSLVWLIGAFFTAIGLSELFAAVTREEGRGLHALLGVADTGLGVLVLLMMPGSALQLLAVVIGVSFILRAVVLVTLGLLLRKAAAISEA